MDRELGRRGSGEERGVHSSTQQVVEPRRRRPCRWERISLNEEGEEYQWLVGAQRAKREEEGRSSQRARNWGREAMQQKQNRYLDRPRLRNGLSMLCSMDNIHGCSWSWIGTGQFYLFQICVSDADGIFDS